MYDSLQFSKVFSLLLSFFGLSKEGYALHSLRRGGATHFFQVTGNLSATLEMGRWLSLSSGRMYITEGLSVLAHRKIKPATATALRIAAEELPNRNQSESAAFSRMLRPRQRYLRHNVLSGRISERTSSCSLRCGVFAD